MGGEDKVARMLRRMLNSSRNGKEYAIIARLQQIHLDQKHEERMQKLAERMKKRQEEHEQHVKEMDRIAQGHMQSINENMQTFRRQLQVTSQILTDLLSRTSEK
ncbi:hypothetical protein V6N13_128898 [Hibiscus sabdariffa]|uniref:Uncharacterized protein n=1 Tax=Hibiscus sabdariffa TaxID=183260 RepID=A0ABR2SJU8_9ROSI